MAEVSIYEMMDYLQREKIQAPALSEEEMAQELQNSQNLMRNGV